MEGWVDWRGGGLTASDCAEHRLSVGHSKTREEVNIRRRLRDLVIIAVTLGSYFISYSIIYSMIGLKLTRGGLWE